MDYIVPPVNTEGLFELLPPYESYFNSNEPVKVIAVRSLLELKDDDPLESIYEAVGLTEETMLEHINEKVPVITFVRENGDYLYVPAVYIKSSPPIDGVIYQQFMLVSTLGLLPRNHDFDLLVSDITSFIQDRTGIKPNVKVVKNSAPTMVDRVKDEELRNMMLNNKYVSKPYMTQNTELVILNNELSDRIAALEEFIIRNNGFNV